MEDGGARRKIDTRPRKVVAPGASNRTPGEGSEGDQPRDKGAMDEGGGMTPDDKVTRARSGEERRVPRRQWAADLWTASSDIVARPTRFHRTSINFYGSTWEALFPGPWPGDRSCAARVLPQHSTARVARPPSNHSCHRLYHRPSMLMRHLSFSPFLNYTSFILA